MRSSASSTAPSRVSAPERATRWARTSVSVSLASSTPAEVSWARSAVALSMIPLCTTEIRPSSLRCGWALRSAAGPWVAHRVWPMPTWPASRLGSAASSPRTRPTVRTTVVPVRPSTARPAES